MVDANMMMTIKKRTGSMNDEMKKRIGEVMCIAPWTELNLRSEGFEQMEKNNKKKRVFKK